MTSFETDSLSRERIVSEIDANFFVEAGAGSGKTTMLVNRMTAMVEAGLDISRICAITFTKAAAGEFYDRFQRLLIERSRPSSSGDAAGGGESGCVRDAGDAAGGSGRPGMLPAPTNETRERCAKALRNIDLCFMGTIDSFCGMILSEHPFEAGIPSDASIVSDEDAATVYKQQYVKICGGAYGRELQSLAGTFQAFYRGAQDVFVQGTAFVMNNRHVHFHFREAAAAQIDRDFAAERSELIRAVQCLAEHPELKYEGNKDSREAWEKITDIARSIRGRWSSGYTNLLYALKALQNIRLIPEALNHYAVSLGPVFAPGGKQGKWLECTVGRADGILERLQKLRYDVSMTFLVRSIPVMEQALREKGYLTFFDYLYYLRNMLRRDAEGGGKLIRYIYERHSYFLVDEFQDTNPLQAEVLFYLSAEHPLPQWSACVPRPGALFIVGDPKQSIYRFRSADVTSFLKVKRLFEKCGSVLYLSRNFRSSRTLCEYFNRVFPALLPEETENQSRFAGIPLPEPQEQRTGTADGSAAEPQEQRTGVGDGSAAEPQEQRTGQGNRERSGSEDSALSEPAAEELQGAYVYKACTGRAEAEHPDETDPVRIADIIERLAGSGRFMIRDKTASVRPAPAGPAPIGPEAETGLRPIRYSDFMVITYGKKKLGPIMAQLAARNIPVRVEGDVPFAGNRALYELGLLYAAAADADDTSALYGALTGSLLALTKEDILRFRACGGSVSLRVPFDEEGCSDEAALRVAASIGRLRDLHALALRLTPAALYVRILDEFRIYETVPAENLEVVYYTLELIRNAGRAGRLVSVKDAAAYIRELITGGSGEERCLRLTDQKDCVHMANLHKVKGLEAPVVILAAAGSGTFQGSCRMIHGDNGSEGYVFSLESERDENGRSTTWFSTSDYADEKAAETEALKAEGQRLVYVAATRARNALILCNSVRIIRGKESADSKWSPIMEPGLPDILKVTENAAGSAAGKPGARVDAASLYDAAEAGSVLQDRSAEKATFRVENPSRLHVHSKLSEVPGEAATVEEGQERAAAAEAEGQERVSAAETEGQERVSAAEAEERERVSAALLGTMTHRLMEMLVTSRGAVDVEAAVGEIIGEYCTSAARGCGERLAQTLLKVADRIRNGGYEQTNGAPRDILGTLLAADEVYCEVPFCYKDEAEENTVWNGVMDVVYCRDGKWHIVDYKTNADGHDLDLRYQGQLSAYTKAFHAATGLSADALTYHIDV